MISGKKELLPDVVTKPFLISMLIVISIYLVTIFVFDLHSLRKIHSEKQLKIENLIMASKKEYIYTVINRLIEDIENDRQYLLKKLKIENPNLSKEAFNELTTKEIENLKEQAADKIRNAVLRDNGYIWVNEVIDYEGGNNYAVRRVHPNMPKTEGMLLSTNTKDAEGNTPYLEELEGVKENGELFFTYWFKKKDDEIIEEKLTYAKLYKPFDWIIATGVYFDDLNDILKKEQDETDLLLKSYIHRTILFALIFIGFSSLLAIFFRSRIKRTLKYYLKLIKQQEDTLLEFNRELDEKVKVRTKELFESKKKLETERTILHDIFESTLSGYWDWDIPNNKEYLSPTFKKMFGYEDEELENSPESWQQLIFQEDLQRVLEIYEKHIKSKGEFPYYSEIRYRHKDGSTIWVICAGRVIEWDEEGNPIRMVGCHIDITERKKLEAKLLDYQSNLENMIKERTEEISKKNDELKRLNDLFVGREHRIKELKERIKSLESSLEK